MGIVKTSTLKSIGVLLMLTLLNACSDENKPAGVISAYDDDYSVGNSAGLSTKSIAQTPGEQKNRYLAYQHNLSIEVDNALIASIHGEIVSQCEADTQFGCVVLNSNLNSGDYQSSQISLRLLPEGVGYFSNIASQKGNVASQSSIAQDLGDNIRDTTKRAEMAINYRDKLLALEAKETDDIDALVKIASELSRVQSEIEFAQGERAKLFQRVETQLLNISLTKPRIAGFWGPISDSLTSFKGDLAYGISDVISSSATIIPWFIFLIILFLVTRLMFRLLRSRK